MLLVLAAGLLLLLLVGPRLYVAWALSRHAGERLDFPGTGGQLARHLLDQAGLHDVAVERTDAGDHYDPIARTVRLGPMHLDGRSITAVAVAAHEVAHAVQHRDRMRLFDVRLTLVRLLRPIEQVAFAVLVAAPLLAILVRSPLLFLLQIVLVIGLNALAVVVHLLTLPVELDASYGRALPALAQGGHLAGADLGRARTVLRAAALTYVAGALVTMLNLARLARVFR